MSEQGILKIRVYTSVAQIPVEGATVVVTAPGRGGKRKLISVQFTDRSGMVKPIPIDTPALGDSLAPEGDGGTQQPFALCDVWAEHPGYAMLKAEGVQIFSGVETLQEMELIPLGEDEFSLEKRESRGGSIQNL